MCEMPSPILELLLLSLSEQAKEYLEVKRHGISFRFKINCLQFYYYTQNNRSIKSKSKQWQRADMSPQQWKMGVDTAI